MKRLLRLWLAVSITCAIFLVVGYVPGAAAQTSDKEQDDAQKKAADAADAKAKIAAMKQHYDAGMAALDQAKQVRAQMDKLPKDQQVSLQSQLDQSAGVAIGELQSAMEGTGESDSNRGILLGKLASVYEQDGKYPQAIDNYKKAIAIKPEPDYYNDLGNALIRTGNVDEAIAAYQKAIELDPTHAATYWLNLSAVLYNTGHLKESIDPLRKATEADPKSAQAWYLLGSALVNIMEFKKEGTNMVPILQPGTVEAFQSCIDANPSGPYAAQAKQSLDALQALGVGISTKVNQSKKK